MTREQELAAIDAAINAGKLRRFKSWHVSVTEEQRTERAVAAARGRFNKRKARRSK